MMLRVIIASFIASAFAHNILDFGAIEDDTSLTTDQANSDALHKALQAANSTDNEDRTIMIPAGKTFSSLPICAENLANVDFVIDGTLLASKHHLHYPSRNNHDHGDTDDIDDGMLKEREYTIRQFIELHNVENITFSGKG